MFIRDHRIRPLTGLRKELLSIGDGLMDVYYGPLLPEQICREVEQQLTLAGHWEYSRFSDWLQANKGFRTITLSDDSEWVLREGHEAERYIHIHPGRYAMHTFRIKAGTLKTAIGAVLFQQQEKRSLTLDLLNQLRTEYLDLSPVKTMIKGEAYRKVLGVVGRGTSLRTITR